MNIVLSISTDVPIYMQIYEQISTQILNGIIPANSQLPTIRQVAADLRISVIPVKMAWEELDRKGFINTLPGKGTFVTDITLEIINEKKSDIVKDLVLEFCSTVKKMNLQKEDIISLIKILW